MKPVILFLTSWCPFCKKALSIIDELKSENLKYKDIDITVIDEDREPETADRYDYYYVPTFYVDGLKAHEGAPSKKKIQEVFDLAIGD